MNNEKSEIRYGKLMENAKFLLGFVACQLTVNVATVQKTARRLNSELLESSPSTINAETLFGRPLGSTRSVDEKAA